MYSSLVLASLDSMCILQTTNNVCYYLGPLQKDLKSSQMFVYKNSTISHTKMVHIFYCKLRWPLPKAHRKLFIWIPYYIFHKRTAIDFLKYFHFRVNMLATRSHSLTLNLVLLTINAFRPHTPFLWLHQCYGTLHHWQFCLS